MEGHDHSCTDSARPVALISFLVTLFIKEVPLSASSGLAQTTEADRPS
ncbi:hypothetical protein ACWCPT_08560 [Streptomyces sp. NPDC002308]